MGEELARDLLSESEFQLAWARGRSMSLDEAISYLGAAAVPHPDAERT